MPDASVRYADVTELRQQIQKETTGKDTILTALLLAASRLIDSTCNRDDGWFIADSTAVARDFASPSRDYMLIPECIAISEVGVRTSIDSTTYTAWVATDWRAARGDPKRPQFNSLPYTLLLTLPNGQYSAFTRSIIGRSSINALAYPTVQITARWGHSADVPPLIREATIMQASRWYKRLEGAMADSLANQQFGQLTFLKKMDPDIQLILENGRFMNPLYRA